MTTRRFRTLMTTEEKEVRDSWGEEDIATELADLRALKRRIDDAAGARAVEAVMDDIARYGEAICSKHRHFESVDTLWSRLRESVAALHASALYNAADPRIEALTVERDEVIGRAERAEAERDASHKALFDIDRALNEAGRSWVVDVVFDIHKTAIAAARERQG